MPAGEMRAPVTAPRLVRARHAGLLLFLGAAPLLATTFTVTSTNDSGAGSLRQAILDANANPGADTIAFAIPGSGVQTISVASALTITDSVVIDGYTEPGASANTLSQASNAVILIDLQGNGTDGLVATGGGMEVHGIALHGFQNAIVFSSAVGGLVVGCFVGVLPSGLSAPGNAVGIWSHGTGADFIGTENPAHRNVISGNGTGILLDGIGSGPTIRGNLIGTNPGGDAAMANGTGVSATVGITLGGLLAGQGNVVSGNAGDGVHAAAGLSVTGNIIGLNATGTKALGNGGVGMWTDSDMTIVSNLIDANGSHGIDINGGGSVQIASNVIGLLVGNHGAGIHSAAPTHVQIGPSGPNWISNNAEGIWMENPGFVRQFRIDGNQIFGNGGLGIVDGATPAIHPNGVGLSFPIITSIVPHASTTTIQGFYDASVLGGGQLAGITLQFYSSPACSKKRPWHFDEGQSFIGSVQVSADSSGHATFSWDAPMVVTDEVITATATYLACAPQCFFPLGDGGFETWSQTGPFSQRLPFSISPASGNPAGGDAIVISGTNFENGAIVTIGGQPVSALNIASATEIDATAPALPPGTANDVSVLNPDGSHGTIPIAWLADFSDVPPAHVFHDYVRTLVTNGVAVGLGGGTFGVDQSASREQMAVLLLTAKHGTCFTPVSCIGAFADVPCSSPFSGWIEQLLWEGITAGCGGFDFCPQSPVRRDQMAVFLLKAEHGSGYAPPACQGVFADVACPSLFADWIEQLANEQITGGCGGGNYCPQNANTRGQMAVFLVKTFGLQ